MSDKAPPEKKAMRREVAAPSLVEALQHLDDMQRSYYDMYVLKVEQFDERDGYIAVTVYCWENQETREVFSC